MTPTDETRALVDAINALVETGTEEIERLRARVDELEDENEWLRWARRASCVRRPTPGCDCPGCETARERAAQVDLVASYEAELEEDRQAERDRILGARVREIARYCVWQAVQAGSTKFVVPGKEGDRVFRLVVEETDNAD